MTRTITLLMLTTLMVNFVSAVSAQVTQSMDRNGTTRPILKDVRRIWNKSKHNAFTDLVRFGDRWFCVFREGSAHVSPDGALRVIRSKDGIEWESAALIEHSSADLRDAKITVTPDGRLMLSGAAAVTQPSDYKHQSMTWFSKDGVNWSEPHSVGDRDFWIWRSTWHKDVAYGIGYATNGPRSIRLYQTTDGIDYQTLVPELLTEGYPNETSMIFGDDDSCVCLLRRDGGSKTGKIGFAKPPYTKWEWRDLGVRIGGPHVIRIPSGNARGQLMAVVRLYDKRARTSLCRIDPESAKLTELLELPSGGDTSYAGMVWHENELWISYYSGHAVKETGSTTSIYLARVVL